MTKRFPVQGALFILGVAHTSSIKQRRLRHDGNIWTAASDPKHRVLFHGRTCHHELVDQFPSVEPISANRCADLDWAKPYLGTDLWAAAAHFARYTSTRFGPIGGVYRSDFPARLYFAQFAAVLADF